MARGMFVDTSICTGCKACQVACKAWNRLAPEPGHFTKDPETGILANHFTGKSYDNTGTLGATDWRHVLFIERFDEERRGARWLFMSDSCKHCRDAACLNMCPVNAIVRTDQGNVVVLQDKCEGKRVCNAVCPYGVVKYSPETKTSHKCTLCNDRIHNGLETACAKACPTGSIRFGKVDDLKAAADARLRRLAALGERRANLYGTTQAGGLNVFYLLLDKPGVYGLPEDPRVMQRPKSLPPPPLALGLMAFGLKAMVDFRERKTGKSGIHKS